MIRIVKSHFIFIWPLACLVFKLILIRSSSQSIRRRLRILVNSLDHFITDRTHPWSCLYLVIKIFPHHRSWFEPRYTVRETYQPSHYLNTTMFQSGVHGLERVLNSDVDIGVTTNRPERTVLNSDSDKVSKLETPTYSNWSSKDVSADPWTKNEKNNFHLGYLPHHHQRKWG